MDFLDPKKKRAHRIRLYVGYFLMAIALGIGTMILAFEAYGYDFDRHNGQIIQNGLIFVDAHPESASIYLNGEANGQTDNRLVVPAGKYKLELKRDGYRTWQKEFALEGHSIERFIYPFLFPSKMVSKNIQQYASMPTMSTESPDRHWQVTQQPGQYTKFDTTDLSNDKGTVTSFSLPDGLLTAAGPNHQLEAIEWSTDNKNILLKHTFDGGTEFAVIDRTNPANSYNINKTFNLSITEARLRDKKADEVYILDTNAQTLKLGAVKAKTTKPVLDQVVAFHPDGADQILYVDERDATSADLAQVRLKNDNDNYLLKEVPRSKKYLIDMARFDGRWYVALGSVNDNRVYIYRDPIDQIKNSKSRVAQSYRMLREDSPQFVSFSANARFIGLQSGSKFAVYDAETNRQYRFDTKLNIPLAYQAEWMDGHRYAVVSDGKVVVFEFDGKNSQTLVSADARFKPSFDRDYTAMYEFSVTGTPPQPAFVRTELKIKK